MKTGKETSAKQRRTEEDSCLLLQLLPKEMLTDILSVFCSFKEASLLRSVCKAFSSATEDRDFNLQLGRADTQVFLRDDTGFDSTVLHMLDVHSISSLGPRAKASPYVSFLPKRDETIMSAIRGYDIVNSCYGLICLRKRESFRTLDPYAICNPVTCEVVMIPEPVQKDTYISFLSTVSGFGCSIEGKDYKVVRVVTDMSTSATNRFPAVAEIYRLGDTSWKSIGYVPNMALCDEYAVFLNGEIHWVCDGWDGRRYILNFSVEHEKFGSFELPSCFQYFKKPIHVGVLRGCIYASKVVEYHYRDFFEIWVMRTYGEHDSWNKLFSIRSEVYGVGVFFEPICLLENDELVLMCNGSALLFYNLVSSTAREFKVNGGGSTCFQSIQLAPHFGSLKDIFRVKSLNTRSFMRSNVGDVEAISVGTHDGYTQDWLKTLSRIYYFGWN